MAGEEEGLESFFKNKLFGWFTGQFSSVTQTVDNVASTAEQFGGDTGKEISQFLTDLSKKISDLFSGLLGNIDAYATKIRSFLQTKLSDPASYMPVLTPWGLDTSIAQGLADIVSAHGEKLMANGVPAKDANGHPAQAILAANATRKEIITYLVGTDTEIGAIRNSNPNLTDEQIAKMADDIATRIIALPANASVSMAMNPPKTGVTGLFADAMNKNDNLALTFDTSNINAVVASVNKPAAPGTMPPVDKGALAGVSGGADVDQHDAAPATGKRTAMKSLG